jgi:filamentous hemagglutinin
MNKHLYRIIFNERRGQLMVVGDNVMSVGKTASGERSAVAFPSGRTPPNMRLRPICMTLYVTLGMLVGLAAPVHAQIVADPNAPGAQRATVLQTSNGVVQVNIQTPSAAGVSRNVYSQFDVTAKGAMLNNSRTDVQSQIGGWVQGNPWLAGGSARVILNEVNSADPSKLHGYLEVAGQRAELVIANPSGVNVDGGGFINASRVTITTGVPRMSGGSLDGYLVERGAVTINGRGMDATEADYVGILARAIQVNAGIWAKDLRIVGGVNQINAEHTSTAAQAGAGSAPAFALDVAYLGGMYAGKIMLIGTEAGVGMRNAGTIAASASDLVLESNGWLKNSGSIQATAPGRHTHLDVAGDIDNAGTVYASGDTRVESRGNIVNSGLIAAQADNAVRANGTASHIGVGTGGIFASGLKADGTLGATGNMEIFAAQGIAFHGLGTAAGNVELRSTEIDLSGAQLSGNGLALAATNGNVNATGANINAHGALVFGATGAVRTDKAQVEANTLSLGAHDLFNVGGKISQLGSDDLAIVLPGTLDNTAGRISVNSGSLFVAANSLANVDGTVEHAGTGTLAVTAGSISGARGTIISNGSVDITTGEFDHRRASTSGQQVVLSTAHLDNSGGRVSAIGSATVAAAEGLDNTDGSIGTGANLTVQAGDVANSRGVLQAGTGDVTLQVAGLNNAAGTVYAGGKLDTMATHVDNSGSMYASGDQHLSVSGAIINSGVIAAQGHTTVTSESLASSAASLLGAGIKADGTLAQGGDLTVTTAGNLATHGHNLAAGQVTLLGGSVDVSASQTSATGIAFSASGGNVMTSDATIVASGTLAVQASQTLDNTHGTLSAGQLEMQVANLDNKQGTIIQSGASDTRIVLTSADGQFDNTEGRIAVNSASLALGAGTLVNTDGHIEHAGTGTLNVTAANIDDQHGQITSNGNVVIAAGAFDHTGANVSGRAVSVHADSLNNRGGHVLQSGAGELTLQVAHQLDNAGGEIAADGSLQVQAGDIVNSAGRFTSAASSQLASAGVLDNSDGVVAAAHALVVDGKVIDNSRGTFQASAGTLSLSGTSLLNSGGMVSAGTDLMSVVVGELSNTGVMYAGHDHRLDVGGAFINTGSAAALGNMAITAGSVDSGHGALLGAGIDSAGNLAQSGTLTVSAVQGLRAAGQNLAAGDMSLSGSSVDLDGSESSAANIAIAGTSGNVTTRNASMNTAGRLSVTANAVTGQSLDNGQGSLSAGQFDLHVSNLNNNHGTLIQSGSGDTNITLSTPSGTLDNTSGRIATNASDLTLGAGLLVNTDGRIEHAGAGKLAINAATLNDQRGQIIGNGTLAITAGEVDHRSASTSAQQVSIMAVYLNNQSGQIAQLGTSHTIVTASGTLDNVGGRIDTNGDAAISASTLTNTNGRISAQGSMALIANAGLNNTDGSIATGANLTVLAGNADNTRGVMQAGMGDVTLRVADLNNAAGSVYAGGKLDTTARYVDNSGSMYAAGDQRLSVTGAILNSGVIAAQGHTTVTSESLASSAASLLGAGMKADGTLAQAGNLTVTTAGNLAAHGHNLAAGQATFSGASVDVSGSQIGATGIALSASDGNVTTRDATIVASGTLAVSASQALANTHGTLSAGQLEVQVANLDNKQGTIIQSGAGDTRIVLTSADGQFDNTEGRIAVNSANLALGAGTLVNTGAQIEHAGTGALNITAARLDGQRGQITSNGGVHITTGEFDHNEAITSGRAVTVQADSLNNRGGHVLQSGTGELTLQITHQLDNAGGEIAADGSLQVQASDIVNSAGHLTSAASSQLASGGVLDNSDGVVAAAHALLVDGKAIDNSHGTIQAGTGTLSLSSTSLLNSDGVVSAGTNLMTVVAGELRNTGAMYAGGDHRLDVGGAFINTGSVAALGNMAVTAGSVDSGHGALLGAGIDSAGNLVQSGTLTVSTVQGLRAAGQNLAAGDMSLSGLSVDLDGSESGAANIAITATGGNVTTRNASVNTAGGLSVSANAVTGQSLDNGQGSLSAGQFDLHVSNLNNNHGTLIQSGSGDTNITLSAPSGMLDNTSGRIATNAANLTLGAGLLVNTDGRIEHAGAGALAINAATLSDQRGQIIGNGTLAITAGEFDHRSASTTAQQVSITAANLNNQSGQIAQLGTGHTIVTASGTMDNAGGRIETNGGASVGASTLTNTNGRISAQGSMALTANAGLNNTDGSIATGANLTVQAGDVDNTRGVLQAGMGDVTLQVAGLNNAAGSVYAGGKLDTTATHVNNSGSLYAAGDQHLSVNGVIVNSGVIAAQGHTTVTSESLASSAAGLLGAGMKADGTLAQAGDLTVTTAGSLATHGHNLAAGQATFSGASVDVSASQTGATGIALSASGGNVTTSNATIVANGTLAVQASQTLANTRGTLSAGQLEMQVANLDNKQGTIIQSGAGDTRIVLTSADGRFDNTEGHIAVNSASLALGAGTLVNTGGQIEHAGTETLNITAANIDGQYGQITSNGGVLITAGHIDHQAARIDAQRLAIAALSLDNREGSIIQVGSGPASIAISDTFDNRSGRVASNGNTAISAGTLYNQSGIVQVAGAANLDLRVDGALDNRQGGGITAGKSATITAGSILNQLGQISAGGTISATVREEIQNDTGRLIAGGDVQLVASTLNNTGGKVASVLGNVSASTGGMLVNDSGVIQAGGGVALQTAGLSNTQALGHGESGSIVGRNVQIDTNGHTLANQSGTIASAEKLDVHSGALNNNAGLLQAGTTLSIDTHGHTLSNLNAAGYGLLHSDSAGGIVSAGGLSLNVGDWFNAGGFLGAGGALSGSTAMIDNTRINDVGGQIVGQSTVTLSMAGLKNQGGQIQSLGNTALNAGDGVIDNREGLIRSGAKLALEAHAIDNGATQSDGRGMEGQNIEVTTALLTNNRGAIRADNNAVLNSTRLIDNTEGIVSAGNTLHIVDPALHRNLALINTGGTLIAGEGTNVRAATMSGDGRLLSLGDITVDLSGNYEQQASGEITANNNASIIVGGDLRNSAQLHAGAALSINARNIDNLAGGDISAGHTRIDVADTLNNRGLIDGVETQVNAGTLNNMGTGRIYGDNLSIAASQVNNESENGKAATIAARNRLDIGTSKLSNSEHAIIFSSGDMALGGTLNADRQAIGRADNITNASATIEALGQLNLSALQVNNLNNHFSTAVVAVGAPISFTEYQGIRSTEYQGINNRYLAGTPGVYTFDDGEFFHLATPETQYNEQWAQYDTTRTTQQTVVMSSDPGRIVSGGNLTIDADSVLNNNSHILAGGKLSISIGALNNIATDGQKITTDSGKATLYTRIHQKGTDRTDAAVTFYTLPDVVETISLGSSRVEEYTATGGMTAPGAVATGRVRGETSAAGSASAEINPLAIVKVAANVTTVSPVTANSADLAGGMDGLSGTTPRVADQVGSIKDLSGTRVVDADRPDSTHSTSSMAVQSSVEGVGERQVNAVSAMERMDESNRVGTVGHEGVNGSATGHQASLVVRQGEADGTELSISHVGVNRTGADVVAEAAAVGGVSQGQTGNMVQVTLEQPSNGVQIVRTSAPFITLPNASLYTTDPAPTARYLVVTDPRFANYRQWLSSDYMVQQLELDPSVTQKRLGDGYYEQSLIRAQVAQLTGQRYLAGYTNDDEEYRALMNAGVAVAKTLNLRPGVALSAAQMAALTDDIVWMVEKEVTLAGGGVQKVLVPQVYARVREGDLDGGGALLAGKDVEIRATGELVNRGSIGGRDSALLTAQNIQNLGGRIQSDMVSVEARNDLNNIGGQISANSALIARAGRDINVETTTRDSTSSIGSNSFARTSVDQVAGLYVTGDGKNSSGTLVVEAGRDVNLMAGQIGNAAQDGATVITAGRNLNLSTVGTASSNSISWDPKNYRKDSTSAELGGQIQASGAIMLSAGVDMNARAADVQAGISLSLIAGNDINLVSGVTTAKIDEGYQSTHKGFLNSKTITTRDTLDRSSALGTSLGGDSVSLIAGNDIKVSGSTIAADGDVNMTAAKALTITAATETSSESHHISVQQRGLMSGGGFGFSYGTRTTTTDQQQDASLQSGQARSIIGSTAGSVKLTAGTAITVAGSHLSAAQDMSLLAKSIAITPGQDQVDGKFTSKMTQDGLTLAVGGNVINAIGTIQGMSAAAGQTNNTRLKALAAATAAVAAKNAASDIAANGVSISLSLTAGHSESEQTQTIASTSHTGSTLAAGNNIAITATGGGADSNVAIIGSDVSAKNNVSLRADNQVNLLAAQDLESQHSQSKSMSAAAGIGASYSSKGGAAVGIIGSVSASRGAMDGEGVTQINTHIDAGAQLSIASGGDTNLKGAVASASQVIADVKGNLNIASLQDTARFDSKEQSASVSGTYGYGANVNASFSQSTARNDYASVQEQSGMQAGDGGFQITVGGNTDLKGGVISSTTAGAVASSLVTATLTHSDINNHATSSASGIGIGGGFTLAGNGGDAASKDEGKIKLMNMGSSGSSISLPSANAVSNSATGVTRSGVGAGTLVITNDVVQRGRTGQGTEQATAGINRNFLTGDDTSGRTANSFNPNAMQAELAVTSGFTAVVAPLAARTIGDIGKAKQDTAQREADAYGLLAADAFKRGENEAASMLAAKATEAQAISDAWGDNGINRVTLHTAAQGVIGGLASGSTGALNSVTGVVGGNLGQQLGKKIGEVEADQMGLQGQERANLISTYQNNLAVVGGAVAGVAISSAAGATGGNGITVAVQAAETANAVDTFNRQLHPKEVQVIKEKASDFAKVLFETAKPNDQQVAQAQAYLVYAALADVDRAQMEANVLIGMQKDDQYIAAKKYLTTQKEAFVNEAGQLQKVFTTKGDDFYSPLKYSNNNANQAYRDFFWNSVGINLPLLSNASSAEKKLYGERENQRLKQDIKSALPGLITGAVLSGVARLPATTVRTGNAKTTTISLDGSKYSAVKIENNFGRDADITTGLRLAEDVNKLFAEKGYDAPFTNGTHVEVSVTKPGARTYMVVSDTTGQAQALDAGKPAIGAFATPDPIPSQIYARETLAITPSMKPDVSKVVQLETTGKPVVQIQGKVAPQEPIGTYPGNGNQVFYDYPSGSIRTEYVKPLGPTQSLPAHHGVVQKIVAPVSPSAVSGW